MVLSRALQLVKTPAAGTAWQRIALLLAAVGLWSTVATLVGSVHSSRSGAAVDGRWAELWRNRLTAELQSTESQHVLVTGAAGYIGSHAVLRLLDSGYRVTGVDNFSRGNRGAIAALRTVANPGQFSFVELDLGVKADLHQLFTVGRFDAVLHFAALAYVAESVAEPVRYFENITVNTVHLLEAMRAHGVPRLIYSSSCAVYGDSPKMPVTEDSPTIPLSPYGKSKLIAEQAVSEAVRSANPTFSAIILRYFNVIGADPSGLLGEAAPPHLVKMYGRISDACFSVALGQLDAVRILGTNHKTPDGTCIRDYIHIMDLVEAHLAVLKKDMQAGQLALYNVAVGQGHSVREFIAACQRTTGHEIPVAEMPARTGDPPVAFADSTKLQKELSWRPRYTDLDEALKSSWAWRQAHSQGY